MKSFTVAAILASTAAALPASLPVPTCLPSSIVPSGVVPSGIPTCLPTSIPTGLPSANTVSNADTKVADKASSGLHNVVTVTNQASKNILVELEPEVASKMSKVNLGSLSSPIGTITQVAPSVSDLNLKGLGAGYLTVATSEGQVALVQLTSDVESLLAGLGLPQVGTLVGGVVGKVEGLSSGDLPLGLASGGLASGSASGTLSIKGLKGGNLLVQVEPTLFSLISSLPFLSTLEGPVGSVLAQVPAGSDLLSKASSLGADPSQLIAVLSQNGASVLLVEVESTLSGLLSKLGLSVVQSTIGSVVPAGASGVLSNGATGLLSNGGAAKGASNVASSAASNIMSITNLNGENLLVQVEPTLFSLISSLPLVSSLEGPIGSVLARVPAGSDLLSKASSLGADPSQLIAVLSQNGASVLLVEVESTLSGLLSQLGLSVVQSTIGSVVPAGAAGIL